MISTNLLIREVELVHDDRIYVVVGKKVICEREKIYIRRYLMRKEHLNNKNTDRSLPRFEYKLPMSHYRLFLSRTKKKFSG